jgi:hypothetical protein
MIQRCTVSGDPPLIVLPGHSPRCST